MITETRQITFSPDELIFEAIVAYFRSAKQQLPARPITSVQLDEAPAITAALAIESVDAPKPQRMIVRPEAV